MSRKETIFAEVLALEAESHRTSFLDRACAGLHQGEAAV